MDWLLWGIVLLLQNASFTWVSLARMSESLIYHASGALCSNGIWFISQIVVVSKVSEAIASNDWWLLMGTGLFYMSLTATGSVLAHKWLMKRDGLND